MGIKKKARQKANEKIIGDNEMKMSGWLFLKNQFKKS